MTTKETSNVAKVALTPRQRFGLFVHLNAQSVANRAEGRRLDRAWESLALDEIAEAARRGANVEGQYDADGAVEYELTSDARDALIDYLDKPMSGGLSRILTRVGHELLRSRDGGG